MKGIYWGDGSTLDAAGGDYQYIENIRVVHKASREVRILAIRRIGNRALNSTPNSIELNKGYYEATAQHEQKHHYFRDSVPR
nr:DUF2586 family protein [Shewanella vesiculosa]